MYHQRAFFTEIYDYFTALAKQNSRIKQQIMQGRRRAVHVALRRDHVPGGGLALRALQAGVGPGRALLLFLVPLLEPARITVNALSA